MDKIFVYHPKPEKIGTEVFNSTVASLIDTIKKGSSYEKEKIFSYVDENGVHHDISYFLNNGKNNWVKHTDGYYYYTLPVAPKGKTEELLVEEDGKIKFLDSTGKIVIDNGMKYDGTSDGYVFHGGYIAVCAEASEKYGLMDNTGNMVRVHLALCNLNIEVKVYS